MSRVRNVIETLMSIYDKEGQLVPFKFNSIQAEIDRTVIEPIERFRELGFEPSPEFIQETIRASILKYRQGGVTTLIMAWFLVECMTRYSVCVMLTHDKEHSEKLLYRARLMLKNLKGPKPKTSKLNDNEIAFAKTDSVFYIGTAGSKEFGRSATITHLHCSEIAFWKDPASLMKSLFQAVPKRSGIIIQETTANGWGNWFQKSFYNYRMQRGGFRGFFFPWYMHNEYTSATPFELNAVVPEERLYERRLYKRIRRDPFTKHLSPKQVRQLLQWRREKIDENQGDRDRQSAIRDFNQEYPSTIEEAFVLTGGSLFGDVRATDSPDWVHVGTNRWALRPHPVPGYTYALGADFSGGTGNDNSTIEVLCLDTRSQVFEFADNHINPIDFAELIVEIGLLYNTAYLVPENNAHGLAGTAIIKRVYPLHRIYKHQINKGSQGAHLNIPTYGYGWKTTATTKPYLVGIAQQLLYAGWTIHSLLLEDELRSFVEDPDTGKMEGSGAHDDRGISFMLACIGVLKLLRLQGFAFLPDEIEGAADVPLIEPKATQPAIEVIPPIGGRSIQVTWRDEQGRALIPFSEMFSKKSKRSVHA